MEGMFDSLTWWHWLVLAVVFLILEVFSPAAFFMWMGFAAAITALVALAVEMSWEIEFMIFAVLSIASILIGRAWFQRHPIESEQPAINERGTELVGKMAVVETPIVNGTGRIHLGDTTWKVSGPDAPAGQKVRIVGSEGSMLQVELVN
jgi:membrane protein implicated in regulation of membrane protease activity